MHIACVSQSDGGNKQNPLQPVTTPFEQAELRLNGEDLFVD